MSQREPEITGLLRAHERGESGALDEVVRVIYGDLKPLARSHLRPGRRRGSLNTTALVHEAYVRLVERKGGSWRDRRHFLAAAATAMRHVVVDQVRARMAAKRGGGRAPITLDDEQPALERQSALALEVNAALESLRQHDPRLLWHLGETLGRSGDLDEAGDRLRRALAVLESAHGPDHPRVVEIREALAALTPSRSEAAGSRAAGN